MKTKISLGAILLLLALAAACEQPAGTGGAVITVSDAASLAKIGADPDFPLNGSYALASGLTLPNWKPIGTSAKPFAGTFNGGGNTLVITGTSGGLFGCIAGAAVRNLKVDVTVTVNAAAGLGAQAGGIAGSASRSTFENCTAQVNITVTAHSHNSSAGGIAGTIKDHTTIRSCAASGVISLDSGMGEELMVYAGGIAGDAGFGQGVSGSLITRSSWNGAVSASGGYPYCGGIAGYNYSGAAVTLCSASGTVRAAGNNLPYAGGIAGYNSGGQFQEAATRIEDCYSAAAVTAESNSKHALAGGIAGANANKGARISRCYSAGAVSVTVAGDSPISAGSSIGPPPAASAGGIAGAQYAGAPVIEYCAALNASLTGVDSGSGAAWNIYRIAGAGASGSDTGQWLNNLANEGMDISLDNNGTRTPDEGLTGKDGENCAAIPDQSAYTALGWNFDSVWKMGSNGYPALR
jgi:hypothetical protein